MLKETASCIRAFSVDDFGANIKFARCNLVLVLTEFVISGTQCSCGYLESRMPHVNAKLKIIVY